MENLHTHQSVLSVEKQYHEMLSVGVKGGEDSAPYIGRHFRRVYGRIFSREPWVRIRYIGDPESLDGVFQSALLIP
jgi:hypothetical protein